MWSLKTANGFSRRANRFRARQPSLFPLDGASEPLRDVDEAQMYMVALAKELADKDEIVLADKSGGGDQLIY